MRNRKWNKGADAIGKVFWLTSRSELQPDVVRLEIIRRESFDSYLIWWEIWATFWLPIKVTGAFASGKHCLVNSPQDTVSGRGTLYAPETKWINSMNTFRLKMTRAGSTFRRSRLELQWLGKPQWMQLAKLMNNPLVITVAGSDRHFLT